MIGIDFKLLQDEFAKDYPIGLRRAVRARYEWVEEDGEEYRVAIPDDVMGDHVFLAFEGRLRHPHKVPRIVLPLATEFYDAVEDPEELAEMIWPSVEIALEQLPN